MTSQQHNNQQDNTLLWYILGIALLVLAGVAAALLVLVLQQNGLFSEPSVSMPAAETGEPGGGLPLVGELGNLGYRLLFFLLIPAVAVLSTVLSMVRSSKLLHTWAARNGYRIVQQQRRWLRKGPFLFRTSRAQTVYRITVANAAGRERTGWAKCGNWFFGLFINETQVQWDEPDVAWDMGMFGVSPGGDQQSQQERGL